MVCVRNIVESVLDVMPTGAVHVEPKRLAVEAFLLIVPISYNGIGMAGAAHYRVHDFIPQRYGQRSVEVVHGPEP